MSVMGCLCVVLLRCNCVVVLVRVGSRVVVMVLLMIYVFLGRVVVFFCIWLRILLSVREGVSDSLNSFVCLVSVWWLCMFMNLG